MPALQVIASRKTNAFRTRLLSIMDRKDHPSYWRLMGPGVSRSQLLVHYRQEWGVYVRDFPIFLARVLGRCPDPGVRRDLAENLYEEETGGISGGGPHGELFLRMMDGLGFARADFDRVRLLAPSHAFRAHLDRATLDAPWIVGLAVATIFVEGSRNDRAEIENASRDEAGAGGKTSSGHGAGAAAEAGDTGVDDLASDPLVVHHGLDPRFLELKRVHRKVEGGHRLSAWGAVLAHARSERDRARVAASLEKSLRLWHAYRDGVSRAAKL